MALGGQPMLATPLTRTRKSGELYRRPPDVEAQLEELLRMDPAGRLSRARVADKGSPQHLKEECLVYLIREAILADDADRYHALAAILLKRLIRPVERQLRALGVADDDVEDLHQEVMQAMMTAIAEGRSGEFYQVRFRRALRRQVLKRYDSYRRRKQRSTSEQSLDAPVSGREGIDDNEHTFGDLLESTEDVAEMVEQRLLVREALSTITNQRHREAFVLHYYYGWQIESSNLDEQTLSRLYDRTPKMIRIWLRTAERQVAEWRAAKGL
jgi:DNA-directed RNA polymerase specialized sigma24 family protein